MSCFVNGSLFTEVLPLCGCLTFLKANYSPALQTCFSSLWTCAQCAGGPFCEVFACTCTGSTCFAVVAGVEGVMVLKEVSVSGTVGTVLELYWHCMALSSICRATGMEEDPKATLDIQCLRRGGGAALI